MTGRSEMVLESMSEIQPEGKDHKLTIQTESGTLRNQQTIRKSFFSPQNFQLSTAPMRATTNLFSQTKSTSSYRS